MTATTEKMIASHLVSEALKAGFTISVNDGEETVLTDSRDHAAIRAAMFSTDEDWLILRRGDLKGWVRLIYGNDTDLISDYTTNLESALAPTLAYVDKLDEMRARRGRR